MTEELTDEQLFILCEQAELENKKIIYNDSADKGIDWKSESFLWEEWNPLNFK